MWSQLLTEKEQIISINFITLPQFLNKFRDCSMPLIYKRLIQLFSQQSHVLQDVWNCWFPRAKQGWFSLLESQYDILFVLNIVLKPNF